MAADARKFVRVQITRKGEIRLREGHPWVYDTEVVSLEAPCEDGSLVEVVSPRGRYLGVGFYNSCSKIRIRVISTNANDRFDRDFFRRRLKHAWEYRKTVMGADIGCCRLIFGEADQFPGLTVDRCGDILVTQTLSLGIEKIKPMLFEELLGLLREDGQTIRGIYERNDVSIRRREGMEENKGFFRLESMPVPDSTETRIQENGIRYIVDFENGQKTGFFLDQKYNRRAAAALAGGKKVLDCFTHTGSFALNAAKAGAACVHAVDISADAVAMAQRNAHLNGLEANMSFETANVFDLLHSLPGQPYDYIILDPPAFTKSHQTVDAALRGYKEINLRAMKLLPRGGYLATCSCSHFMTEELFCKMLRAAAFDAKVALRQIEARQQSPDHPILWNVPETNYLKFYLFQVV